MIFYLNVFIIISFLACLESLPIEKRVRNHAAVFVAVLFVLIAGLRYETGVDWKVYSSMFNRIPPIDKITSSYYRELIFDELDLGYSFLTSTVKYLGGSIQLVFFVISLCSSIFLFKSLQVYTPFVITGLFIYYNILFFFLDMSGIRQGIALSIFFFSLQYVRERRLLKFGLLIILATLFHWTSILLFPLYFLLNLRISMKFLSAAFVLSLVLFFLKVEWLTEMINLAFSKFENKDLLAKAFVYTTNPNLSSARTFDLNTILAISYNLIFFILFLVFRKKLEARYSFFNIFFNLFLLQNIVFFAFSELIDLSERLRFYFSISNVVLLPYFIGLFRLRAERLAISILISLYCLSVSRAYVFEREGTIAFHPYQNYIIHKAFDLKSTGNMRLLKHERMHK